MSQITISCAYFNDDRCS